MNPFPAGTRLQVRITKEGKSLETNATVVYSEPNVGMGLRLAPGDASILPEWIRELRGEAPPEFHRLDQDRQSLESHPGRMIDVVEQLIFALMRNGLLTEEEAGTLLRKLLC
jgi:hypothetical protein